MANPSYNAVMSRYKTGPRGPKAVSKETLSRLSDPARGKFTSPSREAEKDALFKADMRRKRDEENEPDGSSFFLTEINTGRPPVKSSFRTRLEQVARAAETINEDAPLSPAGNKYTSAQRISESKRRARLMENLLHGQDAVRGARDSAKQTSQTRQAAARLNRVKGVTEAKPTTKKSRYDTGGNQMSRNRQAKLDSQAKIMRGSSKDGSASYDARTGRVRNRSTSRSRDPSANRGSNNRDRSVDKNSRRGRSNTRALSSDRSVDQGARGRSTDNNRPEWIENPNSAADKDNSRKEKLSQRREERRKVFAEKKSKNEKILTSSIRSNSSADISVNKIPTGVMSGSRSAASISRKPSGTSATVDDFTRNANERRAKTEQRTKKNSCPHPGGGRVGRPPHLKTHVEGNTPPVTMDSETNNSLQYSVSSKGSPNLKSVKTSPSKLIPAKHSSDVLSSSSRMHLLEKKGLPAKEVPKPITPGTKSMTGIANRASSASTTENRYPERFRTADRDELIGSIGKPVAPQQTSKDSQLNNNVEMALKKAEEMSRALQNSNDCEGSVKADHDTLSFASLLATHAKRISGKLETAQSMDESYKKLTGTFM